MNSMSMPAQAKYIILSVLFVTAAVNFTRTTLSILENSKRLDNVKGSVAELEARKIHMEEQLAYEKTNEFIEKKARNELNMVKPGEKVFVIPQILGENTEAKPNKEDGKMTPARAWIELFF